MRCLRKTNHQKCQDDRRVSAHHLAGDDIDRERNELGEEYRDFGIYWVNYLKFKDMRYCTDVEEAILVMMDLHWEQSAESR